MEKDDDDQKNDEIWLGKNIRDFPIYGSDICCPSEYPCGNPAPYTQDSPGYGNSDGNFFSIFNEKLVSQSIKAQIDIIKAEAINSQKIALEKYKQNIREKATLRRELVSYEIYKDSAEDLFFVQVGAEDEKLYAKKLCNISGCKSYLLQSFGEVTFIVLKVIWRENSDGVCFRMKHDGISPQKVIKVLRTNGVIFRFSRKCQDDVANSLLSFLITSAEKVEIPNHIGWNYMRNGCWHFAKPEECLMEEVCGNAIE